MYYNILNRHLGYELKETLTIKVENMEFNESHKTMNQNIYLILLMKQ